MHVFSNFDSGNIRCLEVSARDAALELVSDPGTEYMHWFHFRCIADIDEPATLRIVNAGRSRTSKGWEGYRAVASYDGQTWFRVPTLFDGDVLAFTVQPRHPVISFAHFAPYTLERHDRLIAWCQRQPGVAVECLGKSLEGRPIELLQIGERGGRTCWITGGLHPGEPMGPWLVEGLLRRLLDPEDTIARQLRSRANFLVVPHVNPDGSFAGRLRTNAAGIDLNRVWDRPDPRTAPEIHALRTRMEDSGVDFYLDVHGDETIPYCFVVGADSAPSCTPRLVELRQRFEAALEVANPDFQREHGYPPEEPGTADLTIGNNWVAERFGCLSLTLEQPFKDPANSPLTEWGWSPARSRALGGSCLAALAGVFEDLR